MKDAIIFIVEYIEEKARRERVVLMSEDEVVALFHRIITGNADADGWIMEKDLFAKIEEEMPDFRTEDYPYTSRELFANHPDCFETEQRLVKMLGIEYPALFVRWIGN